MTAPGTSGAGGLILARLKLNSRSKTTRVLPGPRLLRTEKMNRKNTIKYVPATTTFVNVTDSDVAQIIDYAKSLITDLMPILQVIIAVAIGIIIIVAIINAIRG